jgi:hypothetical protein
LRRGVIEISSSVQFTNWDFLPIFDYVNEMSIQDDTGSQITVGSHRFHDLLTAHTRGAAYQCTLRIGENLKDQWMPLAQTKFGDHVAGTIIPGSAPTGWVFIFPQLRDIPEFLRSFLVDHLPDLVPDLFPHARALSWVHEPSYELPGVNDLREDIERIVAAREAEVSTIEASIEVVRQRLGFLHELLRETDDALVRAVATSLRTLGFTNVIDVDALYAQEGKQNNDEDLRIADRSPLILVEIKGIGGTGHDEELLQVAKYLAPRMQELERLDIKGLTIVNHQRNLPGLNRNHEPFRELVLTNAVKQHVGLLTSWDLFRLVRGYLRHGWQHSYISDLFYVNGRVSVVPTHYREVGSVERFLPDKGVVGVHVTTGEINIGDRLGFVLPTEYEEFEVTSMEVDKCAVSQALPGTLVGIKTSLNKRQMREGIPAYVIRQA